MIRRVHVLILLLVAGLLGVLAPAPVTHAQGLPGGAQLTIVNMTLSAPAVVGASTSSQVIIENRGDASGSITVTWTWGDGTYPNPGAPPEAFNSFPTVVDAGKTITAPLAFTPTHDRRGNQTLVATIQANDNSAIGPNGTAQQKIFIAEPALNVTFEQRDFTNVTEDGWSFARFYVRNDGNANETPNITFDPSPNFTLELMTNFSLILPGHSAMGAVLVHPLAAGDRMVNLTSNLTVNSSLLATVQVKTRLPIFQVNASLATKDFRVQATPLADITQVLPGESYHVPIKIKNTGQVPDVYVINLSLDGSAPWSAALSANASQTNISWPRGNGPFNATLDPNETLTFDAVVNLSADTSTTARLVVNVTSLNAPRLAALEPDGRYRAQLSTQLAAAQARLAIVGARGPEDAYPSDTVRYHFDVQNIGRAPSANATLHVDVEDGLRTYNETNFTIPPLAAGDATAAVWTVPIDALHGDYRIVASIGSSESDLPLHVRQPSIAALVPDEIDVVPGAILRLESGNASLGVRNDGDHLETVAASADSPEASWFHVDWLVDVPAGTATTLPIDISVPAEVGLSTFSVRLHVAVANHTAYSADGSTIANVLATAPPTITVKGPLTDGRVGAPANLTIHVSDPIGIQAANATIRLPTGEADAVALTALGNGDYAGTYTPRAAGNTTIALTVSGLGTPLRTATVTRAWNVLPSAYGGFAPIGFADGSTIGNRTLAFQEVTPGSTVSLTVDLGEGFQALAPPYVAHANWADGPHRVALRAVSTDGETWSRTFNVTLNSTAPAISDHSVAVATDGQVTIHVTAPGATSVAARFVGGSAPVEVPLNDIGGGSFSTKVAPPAGWTSVVLTAKSASGTQSSVTVDHPPASHGVPALGVPLALALALALALVRRRGR